MLKQKKRLGELLIECGLISDQQLNEALQVQRASGDRLGQALVNLGFVTEENLIEVLEFQFGIPHVDLGKMIVEPQVAQMIPEAMAQRYKIIPIKKDGNRLTIAMADPTNVFAVDDVRMFTGCDIDTVVASERQVDKAIAHCYGAREIARKVIDKIGIQNTEPDALTEEGLTEDDAPVISLVNSLLQQAVRDNASDIHVEPHEEDLRVRFRIDGVLREIMTFPKRAQGAIVSRLKIMSDMDISERRIPQDGRIKITVSDRDVDLRVSSLPVIYGEKIVLRILDKSGVSLNVNDLGFSDHNFKLFKEMISQSYGMVLVTGPTGSGKTTTLYAVLNNIASPEKNTVTVEDPVEFRLEGINQVQINTKAGMTFAAALRAILRQDPNIVMIGEIRDTETADIGVRAALTGHLVVSTLHTNDAPSTITRLLDMGIEPFLVGTAVLGVMAQRLVRRVCPQCKKPYQLPPGCPERVFMGVGPDEPITLYKGEGCGNCGRTGYKGRMGIHEVMIMSNKLRELVNKGASADVIGELAKQEGLITMQRDGIDKALAGYTTIQEVMRVALGGH